MTGLQRLARISHTGSGFRAAAAGWTAEPVEQFAAFLVRIPRSRIEQQTRGRRQRLNRRITFALPCCDWTRKALAEAEIDEGAREQILHPNSVAMLARVRGAQLELTAA
jgi:hypothetical protein